MSSVEPQKVVVIQDASKDLNLSAIRWAICGLSLIPGDEVTLLSLLHEVYTPMGYKMKVGADTLFGANQELIMGEVSRKEEDYEDNIELKRIRSLYEKKQIAFHTKVVAASSPKVVAVDICKELGATWIILDRKLKKDKKYFMEMLSCGISRMKCNNAVEKERAPINVSEKVTKHHETSKRSVTNDNEIPLRPIEKPAAFKMIQESPIDQGQFYLEFSPTISTSIDTRHLSDEVQETRRKGNLRHGLMKSFLSTFATSVNQPYISQEYKKNEMHSAMKETIYSLDQRHKGCGFLAEESGHPSITTLDPYNMPHSRSMSATTSHSATDKSLDPTEEWRISMDISFFGSSSELEEDKEDSAYLSWVIEEPKVDLKIDFTYAELYQATNGFSVENLLSEGVLDCVYKGRLKDGEYIAVKRHKQAGLQGEQEFRAEVEVLGKVRHRNVVMLLGSCTEESHWLLVYEYVSKGPLDFHLSKDNQDVLSWRNRIKIALGAAKGLNYLHQRNKIHRNMRASNILITHSYEPLLGDFGLARTENDSEDSCESRVSRTIGYLAPEYVERGQASAKTDVYSFGVVLLELITGRSTMDKMLCGQSLLGWARPLLNERKYQELVDERMLDNHDAHQLSCMISVTEKCLSKDPDKRPPMEKVEYALQCMMDGENVSGMEEVSPRISSFSSLTISNESQSEYDIELLEFEASPSRRWKNQAPVLASYMQDHSRSLISGKQSFDGSLSHKNEKHIKRTSKFASQKISYDEML